MVDRDLTEALARALHGDAKAIASIGIADHASAREAEKAIGAPLIVDRAAAADILRGLVDGRYAPAEAQAWASFMRRGFVAIADGGPVKPLDIAFDDAWEEEIAAIVSRLDEIGDVIDGDLTTAETLTLLQTLDDR